MDNRACFGLTFGAPGAKLLVADFVAGLCTQRIGTTLAQ
jgi:hypothetical protein